MLHVAGFMFDAVVAVGIGACNAQDAAEDGAAVSGEDHRDGIREVNFWGATGRVKFGASTFDRTGTRAEESVFWAAVNMLPPPHYYQVTDYLDPDEEDEWMEVTPFIYADGTTSPPKVRHAIEIAVFLVVLTIIAIERATDETPRLLNSSSETNPIKIISRTPCVHLA